MTFLSRVIYRAGWPSSGTKIVHKGWLRLGPYVIGAVDAWDRSDKE